jgi:hypothetical protein
MGLLSEPGRGFCQDLAFFTQAAIFSAQDAQFLSFCSRSSVLALSLVTIGLGDPVADGLSRGLKLLRKLLGSPSGSNEFYHLVAKFEWIGGMGSWHRKYLLVPKGSGIHETGSTPEATKRLD